jgi:hypothetical protein
MWMRVQGSGTGVALLSLNPFRSGGTRMRLQIGFTLATAFLALFTVALWRQRGRKEGKKEDQQGESRMESDPGLMAA